MEKKSETETWQEWGKHVLKELERLNTNLEIDRVSTHKFQVWVNREIATLQVKSGLWGMGGGLLGLVGVILVEKLTK